VLLLVCAVACEELSCDAHGSCVAPDAAGEGAQCACDPGYAGDGLTCTDVDECSTSTPPCGDHGACTNTDGGYTCACDTGWSFDGATCTPHDVCSGVACGPGGTCYDAGGTAACDCADGWTASTTSTTCVDVNECDLWAPCNANATCANTDGSYTCTCNDGFTGDGTSCEPDFSATLQGLRWDMPAPPRTAPMRAPRPRPPSTSATS